MWYRPFTIVFRVRVCAVIRFTQAQNVELRLNYSLVFLVLSTWHIVTLMGQWLGISGFPGKFGIKAGGPWSSVCDSRSSFLTSQMIPHKAAEITQVGKNKTQKQKTRNICPPRSQPAIVTTDGFLLSTHIHLLRTTHAFYYTWTGVVTIWDAEDHTQKPGDNHLRGSS